MMQRPITVLLSGHQNHEPIYRDLLRAGCNVILSNSELYSRCLQEAAECIAPSLEKRLRSWVADFEEMTRKRRFALSGRDLTKEAFSAYCNMMFPTARGMFVLAETIRRIHKECPIDICVVHNEEAPNLRMMVSTCKQLGIPTLHVVHGAFYRQEDYWCYHDRIRADRVAVESELTRQEWFLSKPYNSPEQIVVTGRPEWDELYQHSPPPRQELCAKLGIDPDRPTLAIVGTWDSPNFRNRGSNTEDALRYTFDAIRDLNGVQPEIIIRPHPGHSISGTLGPDIYLKLAAECGVEVKFVPGDLKDFLDAATVVLTFESTVNGMVTIRKKPLISIINFIVREDDPNWPQAWAQFDGVLGCYVGREVIQNAVVKAFCDEEYLRQVPLLQERLMKELNASNDGHATDNVIALMHKMVREARGASRRTAATVEVMGHPTDLCSPEGDALHLAGEHRTRLLCIPDWRKDDWETLLIDYLTTCRGRRDTVLVVRIEPLLPEMVELAQQVLTAGIQASGIPSEEVPDILLEATPLDLTERPSLFRACNVFLSTDEHDPNRSQAHACGLPIANSMSSALAPHQSSFAQARMEASDPPNASNTNELKSSTPTRMDPLHVRANERQTSRVEEIGAHAPGHRNRPDPSRESTSPKVLISNRETALAAGNTKPKPENKRLILVG